MFDNEEDVKNKIVVPCLKLLGFNDSEIFYEKSFTLKPGRYTYRVDTEEQIRTAQPRLDILIKRDNKNLCIIEVKDASVTIGSGEVDQAVSYGRLIHPIAPLCIITNGKIWLIVDTITKEEIAKDKLRESLRFDISLPSESYYEALQYFLGYSRENLHTFCQQQVNSYMEPLKGSKNDQDKKYIEELYEVRKRPVNSLDAFIQSDSMLFVVTGDSGSGKSCWTCHSALTYLNQEFAVFFYRGSNVEDGMFKAISEDLNWTFSPQYDEIQGIKRLLDIFREKYVLLFIDGFDVLSFHTAQKVLTQFLRRIEGKNVKLILTCKTDWWENFLRFDDANATFFNARVFRTENEGSVSLDEFDAQEFYSLLEKYRAFYHYFGPFEDEVYEACKRNPFLLRVMFEVAVGKQLSYIGYAAVEFYKAYFGKLSSRFKQKEVIQRTLIAIARTLYQYNTEELEFDTLATELGLAPTAPIPESLFELNILERIGHEETTYIGFYFGKLRDYLIAFHALKWQKLSSQDFQSAIEREEISGIRLEALNLYYLLPRKTIKEFSMGLFLRMHESMFNFTRRSWMRTFRFLKRYFHHILLALLVSLDIWISLRKPSPIKGFAL